MEGARFTTARLAAWRWLEGWGKGEGEASSRRLALFINQLLVVLFDEDLAAVDDVDALDGSAEASALQVKDGVCGVGFVNFNLIDSGGSC